MTRISSARVIPIPPRVLSIDVFSSAPPVTSAGVWRVRVEWWGERQAMELDCATEDEASRWMSLVIEPMHPIPRELLALGWGYGGVASHGGVSEAEGQVYRGHYR